MYISSVVGPLEQSQFIRVHLHFVQDTDTDDTDNGSDDDDGDDPTLPPSRELAAELEAAVAALPTSNSTSPPPKDSPPTKCMCFTFLQNLTNYVTSLQSCFTTQFSFPRPHSTKWPIREPPRVAFVYCRGHLCHSSSSANPLSCLFLMYDPPHHWL